MPASCCVNVIPGRIGDLEILRQRQIIEQIHHLLPHLRIDFALVFLEIRLAVPEADGKALVDAFGEEGDLITEALLFLQQRDHIGFEQAGGEQALELTIDLEQQLIRGAEGGDIPFDVDSFRKHCLLQGLDDIGLTLQHVDEIKAYEDRRRREAPWLFV